MTSERSKEPPPYIIPVEGTGSGVKVYHVHTPFTPPPQQEVIPVTSAGETKTTDDRRRYVDPETPLGRTPGRTTCTTCRKQVTTDVYYKAGTYAWLMCLLFICCGLILCCCLIPFFMDRFKDAYHQCPECKRILYVDRKQCCK